LLVTITTVERVAALAGSNEPAIKPAAAVATSATLDKRFNFIYSPSFLI